MIDKESRPSLGLTRVDLENLSAGPRAEQPLVEVRFVNPDGKTEVWMIRKGALPWEDKDFRGAVRLAYLDGGVDTRLENQRDAINRVQAHIDYHHEGLKGVFPCGFEASAS